MREIRMTWNINGCAGCGDWLADTPENRELLRALIEAGRPSGIQRLQARDSREVFVA